MLATDGLAAYYHCAEKKGTRRRPWCRQKRPDHVVEGPATANSMPKGVSSGPISHRRSSPICRRPKFPGTAGGEVPVHGHISAAAHQDGEGRARSHRLRGLEHAHKEIGTQELETNQKNSGFLPEERAWMSRVLDEAGWSTSIAGSTLMATDALARGGRTAVRPGPERRLASRLSAGDSGMPWPGAARNQRRSGRNPVFGSRR